MLRFLLFLMFLVCIGWVISWCIRLALLRWLKKMMPPQSSTPKSIESEKLVQCQTCKTFLTQSRAIAVKDCYYCCQEHVNRSQ